MKKNFTIIAIVLTFVTEAQNLVPNYSFETVDTCPTSVDQIYHAPPWFQPCICSGNTTNSSSSDLFNSCSSPGTAGIPVNAWGGYQFARTGNGYAGIGLYANGVNTREYIEAELTSPLVANRKYCVEYYVSLLEGSVYAISNAGAYFSVNNLLDVSYYHAIDYVTPQIENPISNLLNDTANWMLVSGYFIAAGGEHYITIGNFHNNISTNAQNVGGVVYPIAYYFIDDVSVIDCTEIGVNENNKEDMVEVYPNPATNSLTLTLSKGEGIKEINIYNVLGVLVHSSSSPSGRLGGAIDISFLPKGVYFVNVKSETQSMNRKFVKE